MDEMTKEFEKMRDLHITKFVTPASFTLQGEMKTIPEDFYVNEIDLSGNVVKLKKKQANGSDFKKPPPTTTTTTTTTTPPPATTTTTTVLPTDESSRVALLLNELKNIEPQIDFDQVKNFLLHNNNNNNNADEEDVKVITLCQIEDKSKRKLIHESFRAHFGKQVITSSLPSDSTKIQIVKVFDKKDLQESNRRLRNGSNNNNNNPRKLPDHKFLRFTLLKRDMDLNHVLSEISEKTKIPRKLFYFAGMKDKVGVTTQLIAVQNAHPETLFRARHFTHNNNSNNNQSLLKKYYAFGDLEFSKTGLCLGDLLGNRFSIALRNFRLIAMKQEEEEEAGEKKASVLQQAVEERVGKWKRFGFINYFGLQRFGTGSIGSHLIGCALINREWRKAVDFILKPRAGESEFITEIRERLERTGNAREFLQSIPKVFTAERKIAEGMIAFDGLNQPLPLLDRVPRNLKTIYVHAFQSKLWNAIASLRHDAYGSQLAVVGDLVYCEEEFASSSSNKKPKTMEQQQQEEEQEEQEENELPATIATIEGGDDVIIDEKKVKILTEEDLKKKNWLAKDVILPLPGYNVIYPTTEKINASTYEELLRENGITGGLAQLRNDSQKNFSLSGGYRRFIIVPTDVTHKLVNYDAEESKCSFFNEAGEFLSQQEDDEKKNNNNNNNHALLLSFSLPSGCFATIAIKEFLHSI